MKKALLVLLLCLVCVFGWGTTYYIDYGAADDSANGTSTGTPWKRCPGMQGFAGSYSHSAGDRFIFKGGITWPNSVFRFVIANSGSSGNIDYYGVDISYYTGGSWARPIFDLEGSQVSGTNQVIFIQLEDYITIDNIEIKNFYWAGAQGWPNAHLIRIDRVSYLTLQNLYIHSWTYGASVADDLICISTNGAATDLIGSVIEYSTFHGSGAYIDSGMAIRVATPTIRYNTIYDMSNGILAWGNRASGVNTFEVHDNEIYRIQDSFDEAMHENGIETFGPVLLYNNKIYDMDTGIGNTVIIYTTPSQDAGGAGYDLIYNNLVYGNQSGGIPIQVDIADPYHETSGVYIYNNTLVPVGATTDSIRFVDKGEGQLGEAIIQNVHMITDDGTPISGTGLVNTYTANSNLEQTPATATAQGYVSGNQYAPTTAGDSTVNAGVSKSALFTLDIDGVSRPQGGTWDIGAYEYIGIAAPPVTGPFASDLVMILGSHILWILLPILLSFALFAGYITYQMRLTLKKHDRRIRFFERGDNF